MLSMALVPDYECVVWRDLGGSYGDSGEHGRMIQQLNYSGNNGYHKKVYTPGFRHRSIILHVTNSNLYGCSRH